MFDKAAADKIKAMAQSRIPRQRMQRQYAATFNELVRNIDLHGGRYEVDAWLALYNFKLMTESPQAAFGFIQGLGSRVPLKALLAIEERYYALTDSDHLFGQRLLGLLDQEGERAFIRTRLVSYYVRTGQLSQAADVLRRLVGRAEGQAPLLLRHAVMLGCWSEARSFLADCAAVDPARQLLVKKARLEMEAAARRVPAPLPAGHCFINLPRSEGRRNGIRARWQAIGIEPQFVEAVDGVTMSADEFRLWCPSRRREPGDVGNTLSHFRAWHRLLGTSEPCALVFEDDAWPFADLAAAAELPAVLADSKADIVFVNERLCHGWWEEGRGFRPIAAELARADHARLGLGTDGYLVTRAGAQKLIENYERDRVICPTDWQMVLYSLSPEELAGLPDGRMKTMLARNAALRKSTSRVAAAVLNLPLVRQAITGISTIAESYALAAAA